MMTKLAWGRAWHGRSYDLGHMSLSELWAAYATYPAIQVYAALALICSAAAVDLATRWQPVALSVAATVAAYPVAWYLIHRFILHGRWLYKMKWTAELWKRIHFDHHQDPHLLEVLFGSLGNTLPTIAVVTLPLGFAIGGWPGAAAAFAAGLVTTCVYEFVHCIQHLNYMPKSRVTRQMKQRHLAHHFHNETGNFGIVSFLPDRLTGTLYADAGARPKSASVYNLGYDMNEARRYPWVMELSGAPPRDRPPAAFAPRQASEAGSA